MKFRNLAKIGIVVIWLFFLGWLVQEKYGASAASETSLPQFAPDSLTRASTAAWFNIYIGNMKIGWNLHTASFQKDGISFYDRTVLTLPVAGQTHTVVYEQSINTDQNLHLRTFVMQIDAAVMSTKIYGEKTEDGIRLTIESGGAVQEQFIPVRDDVSLPVTLWKTLPIDQLKPGESYSTPVFDPSTMTTGTAVMRVEGWDRITVQNERLRALRVHTSFGDLTGELWLNEQGEVLQEQSMMDLMMVRVSAEEAQKLAGETGSVDLYQHFAVRVRRGIKHPRKLRQLRLNIRGFSLPSEMLNNHRQLISPLDGSFLLQIQADGQYSEPPPTDRHLEPTPLIQCTDARIVSTSRQIIRQNQESDTRINALVDWVFQSLEKSPSIGLPSATEVLKQRTGDCNEHTVLFVALARAAGIPAKMRAGLVYLQGGFYYHAWPSVYFQGRWRDVDPTFGQYLADATHIALSEGELFDLMTIAQTLGKIKLSIVSLDE